MDLSLVRQDLLQVSTMNRKCMRLLPHGKKRQQKALLGDVTGSLQCIAMKKDQVEYAFRTPAAPRSEITRVELAHAGGTTDANRIFWASGQTIRGMPGGFSLLLIDRPLLACFFPSGARAHTHTHHAGITQKGKEFLRFNTNLTEPIKSMYISSTYRVKLSLLEDLVT